MPSRNCQARATDPPQRAVTRPLANPPRRVAREPRRELQRVRTARADGDFDHVREPTASPGHGRKSVLRRLESATYRRRDGEACRLPHRGSCSSSASLVVFAHGHGHDARDRRRPGPHAGRPQPGRDAGEHPLDDLPARLDRDDPPADLVHGRAQDEADAAVRRGGLPVRLPGGSPDQPRARRQPDRPAQPLARAVSARVGRRQDRERAQRRGLLGELTLAQAQQREDTIKHTQG